MTKLVLTCWKGEGEEGTTFTQLSQRRKLNNSNNNKHYLNTFMKATADVEEVNHQA